MYSYKGDRFTEFMEEPFVVDFSVMIIWPERTFDVREVLKCTFLPNHNSSKNVEQLLRCALSS